MASFKLCDGAGNVIWEDKAFGQNACWISVDGRAVVGLRSPGVEGLAGKLTFFGDAGRVAGRVPVRNFSGGRFSDDGSKFICLCGDRGIAAFDRSGAEIWSVEAGSQHFFNGDGSRLAVVRGRELAVYYEGRHLGAIGLDAPFVENLCFIPGTGGLRFRTPSSETEYDLSGRLVLATRDLNPSYRRTSAQTVVRSTSASWPIDSIHLTHSLGNGWGEYQWYGGSPYLHPGIDVMALTDVGVPVYAVAHGWVKAWLTTSGTWHWRLAIADSGLGFSDSCDGWLYAHIDPNQPHLSVGDEVFPGDWIGHLVPWPVTGFDHLHFARIRDAGQVWGNAGADWVFQDCPLNFLSPSTDTEAPVIEQALAGSRFAYCRDNTSQYLSSGNLTGDVDIIARIYDRFGPPIPYYPEWEKLNPCRVEYAIHGAGGSVPRTSAFLFSHYLPYGDVGVVDAVFKQDDSCVTYGDYDDRQYYYIVTNSDGDTTLEASDISGRWRTTDLPDGHYWVVVYAADQHGNSTADSQLVTVNNYGGVGGRPEPPASAVAARIEAAPNPSDRTTFIRFTLTSACRAEVWVYNRLGERVAALASGSFSAGEHRLNWDGIDSRGGPVPVGAYFLRIEAGGSSGTTRFIRLK